MSALRNVALDSKGNPIQYGRDETGNFRNLYSENLGLWTPAEIVAEFCKCNTPGDEPCPVHCDHHNTYAYTKIDPVDPQQVVICADCGEEIK